MSTENEWLALLTQATSYSDLQNAFARMSVESQTTADGEALATTIDEAIRRIEQERARDQAELDGFSNEYEAFKQQQSGVIGWFKRKLPFTETRKQELGHRDTLNDQRAEILADNFVIVRAQMLKERIVPPGLRRTGHPASYWREQLLQNESVSSIRNYGSVVQSLGQELTQSKLFIDTVSSDIEAFAGANFTSKEDQLRRDADLLAARSELKLLADVSHEKIDLRSSALSRLKSLLISELSEKDLDFRNTNHRLTLVKNILDHHPKVAKMIEVRLASMKDLIAKLVEQDSLPDKREKAEKAVRTLKRELDEATQRRSGSSAEFEGPSNLYNAALRDAQHAKAALNATQPLYDAYIAEQNSSAQSKAEVTADSDFETTSSSVLVEYRRLEEAATASADAVRQLTPGFERAKRYLDETVKEEKTIREKLETQTNEVKKINDLESELEQQLLKARQWIESSFSEFRVATEAYLDDAQKITWSGTHAVSVRTLEELLQDFATDLSRSAFSFAAPSNTHSWINNPAEVRRHSERLESAIRCMQTDQKARSGDISNLTQLRREALQRQALMLLDQSVCKELDFD